MSISNLPGAYTKTGGPRTASGKASVSLNALQSGVYSRALLLPNESEDEYRSFVEALLDNLQPETYLMETLAMHVIGIVWRIKRLEYFESTVLKDAYRRPIPEIALINAIGARYQDVMAAVNRMTDYALTNGVDLYKKNLEELTQLEKAHPGAWPPLSTLKHQHKFLYTYFVHVSGQGSNFDQTVSQNVSKGLGEPYWLNIVKKSKDLITRQINDFSLYADYERAVQKVRNQKMFELLVEDATARPRHDLSRQLQRAMAEYHRERDRFRKEKAVVIDKEPSAPSQEKGAARDVEDVEAAQGA